METIIKISKFSLILIITSLFFLNFVVCEVYTVGDESGWNSGTGTDFHTWSKKYNFTVGDVLEFKYSKLQHNVKEVTDATFRSCDASSGVIAIYESGKDEINLNESRKYNFICDKDRHCLGGMRFSLTVLEASRSNTSPLPSPSPPPPPQIVGKNAAAAIRRKKLIQNFAGIMALLLIFML